MTRATFFEHLCACLPLMDAQTQDRLRAIEYTLDAQTLAWAVQRVVMLGDDSAPPLTRDLVETSCVLCSCTNNASLLATWLHMYRQRKGLPPLDPDHISLVIAISVVGINGPEGFTSIATQLGDDRVCVSTEGKDHVMRPSTPPLLATWNGTKAPSPRRGRVARHPVADVEDALK